MASTKRKSFSVEEKSVIIQRLEAGESNATLAKEFGVNHSTISTIKKNKHKIEPLFNANVLKTKRVRLSSQEQVGSALLQWFKLQRNRGIHVNGPMLQQKANFFAKELNILNFDCSASWINRFKKRHNIVAGKIAGNVEGGALSKIQTVDYAQLAQCSSCKESINGSVYICVQCVCVMCASCDMEGAHAHHYVLRAPPGRTREEVQTVKKEVTQVLAPILEHFNDLPDVEKASTSPVYTEVIIKEELDIEENDPLQQLEMRQAGVGAADVGCAGDARRDGCDAPVAGTSQPEAWPFETIFTETFIKREIDPDEEENQPSLTPHTVNVKSEPVEYEVTIKEEAIVTKKRKRKAKGQDSDDLDDSIYSE